MQYNKFDILAGTALIVSALAVIISVIALAYALIQHFN